jgi:hypothetical protein
MRFMLYAIRALVQIQTLFDTETGPTMFTVGLNNPCICDKKTDPWATHFFLTTKL